MPDAADPILLLAEARRRLARLPDLLEAILADVDDETARRRPAQDEWAPVEIVCHLRDEDTDSLSGLDLVGAWAAHDGLHIQQLAATLTRLWADRWAGLRVGYAGEIPYPPSSSAPSS